MASSDLSPQLSFPSHCWLFGMHFPLLHLKVSAGQPGKHKALRRGSKLPLSQLQGTRAVPRKHSLHSSSSLLSPQSFTLSQIQKRDLQNLFLHVNWYVALHSGEGEGSSQLARLRGTRAPWPLIAHCFPWKLPEDAVPSGEQVGAPCVTG